MEIASLVFAGLATAQRLIQLYTESKSRELTAEEIEFVRSRTHGAVKGAVEAIDESLQAQGVDTAGLEKP